MRLTEYDRKLLTEMLIAVDPPAKGFLPPVPEPHTLPTGEKIGVVGWVCTLIHPNGGQTRKWFQTKDREEAEAWLNANRKPDDDFRITSDTEVVSPKPLRDYNHDPYPSKMTSYDRRFLHDLGIFTHALCLHDGECERLRQRVAGGASEREINEILKRDWLEFERRRKR